MRQSGTWVSILLSACETAPQPAKPVKPSVAPVVTSPHAGAIQDAAVAYLKWGRVDERPRPAPAPCAAAGAMDGDGAAAQVRLSQATDAPHGEKLYYLWANDHAGYLETKVEVGFAIVKESFQAVPAVNAPSRKPAVGDVPAPIATIDVDGKHVTTGDPTGLFVMAKVGGGDTTDAGWVYGTVAPDGTVTSAGRIASCMGCHVDAPHDRLFGLKK